MQCYNKKGSIATIIVVIVGMFLIFMLFAEGIFQTTDLNRYDVMKQYTRDALLIMETKDYIPLNYLKDIKADLEKRLIKKNGENIQIFVTINGNEYDITNLTQDIKTDFGDSMAIRVRYNFKPQRVKYEDKVIVGRQPDTEDYMEAKEETISKNRGVSDD